MGFIKIQYFLLILYQSSKLLNFLKISLLNRLFLESPHIPEDGVSVLRSMLCEDAKLVDISIQIVRQLVHRPTKQLVYLNVLLWFYQCLTH